MKRLIIGSGSMMAWAFMGVLKQLEETGQLKDLEEISSASCGCLVGVGYLYLKSVDTLLNKTFLIDFEPFKPNIKTLIKKWGFIDSNHIGDIARSWVGSMTFKELYEHNPIKIHIAVSDLRYCKVKYLSVDTDPDMEVAKAIQMSCSVPLIFTPNDTYVDGALFEMGPYGPFLGKPDVLEIRFQKFEQEYKFKSLKEYLVVILSCLTKNRFEYFGFPRIQISSDINMFDFKMPRETKLQLFKEGYYTAKHRSSQ
jgi:predicted acylesterase/phospholipase RssA